MRASNELPLRPSEVDRESAVALRVHQEFQAAGYRSLRQLQSFVQEGVLVLRGRVGSFYHKQIAQTLVRRHLQPQMTIDNQILVELAEVNH